MAVSYVTMRAGMLSELAAVGIDPTAPDAGPYAQALVDALASVITTQWATIVTTDPGNPPPPPPPPPVPPPWPHFHLIVVGLNSVAMLATVQASLAGAGFVDRPIGSFPSSWSGWNEFISSMIPTLCGYINTATTTPPGPDGVNPLHTHTWTGITGATLASQIKSGFAPPYPFDPGNAFSYFNRYVDAMSAAIVDEITNNGGTAPGIYPAPPTYVHTHLAI